LARAGPHVVCVHRLDQGRAQAADQDRGDRQGHRQRRQEEGMEVLGEGLPPAGDGEDLPADGELLEQHHPDPVGGHRQGEQDEAADQAVDPAPPVDGRQRRERQADRHREDGRVGDQEEGRPQAVGQDITHGFSAADRIAEVAFGRVTEEDAVLDPDRLVEPEAGPDLGDGLVGRPWPEHDRGRVAGDEADHEEDEQRDEEQHRHHLGEPAEHVGRHRSPPGDEET
jgi:hypothetical protein